MKYFANQIRTGKEEFLVSRKNAPCPVMSFFLKFLLLSMKSSCPSLSTYFMNRLLSNERSKWIFLIGLVAISAVITAKNVISYPTECTTPEIVAMR